MEDERVNDEFQRIALRERLAWTWDIIARYEAELVIRREEFGKTRYLLGKLDERLGGGEDGDHT